MKQSVRLSARLAVGPTLIALAVFASATTARVAGAQSRPDFSGEWTTVPAPAVVGDADGGARGGGARGGGARGGAARGGGGGGRGRGQARGDMGSGWGNTITVTQNATHLVVEYAFFTRGDMQPPLKFTYALNGSATTNSVTMGRGLQEETSTTAWNADSLIITTTHTFPDPDTGKPVPFQIKRTLSLESPTSLVVAVWRSGVLGGAPTESRAVYRKL